MKRPDYGLDAPGVVRNLLLAGGAGWLIWGSAALHWWPGVVAFAPGPSEVRIDVAGSVVWMAVALTAMGLWMIWSSKVGKIREREGLLKLVAWKGDEHVLDIGCGRGLMMIGAAKRLSRGTGEAGGVAVGVDIWQAGDLSGNRPEATLENARLEGVADRVMIQTADMRALPFPDASFDVVVSCAAIHNIPAAAERRRAVHEIARVLKPGGRAVVADILHDAEYETAFREGGCAVERRGSAAAKYFFSVASFGNLRPMTLVARKN